MTKKRFSKIYQELRNILFDHVQKKGDWKVSMCSSTLNKIVNSSEALHAPIIISSSIVSNCSSKDFQLSRKIVKNQISISDASLFLENKKELKTLKNETLIILNASIRFFAEKSYESSANKFNQCKNLVNDHFFLFTYCEAMCFIMSGIIDNVAKSLDLLIALEDVTSSDKEVIQSLGAYGLAKALYALKDYKTAKYKCECGISLLNSIEDTQSYALHSDGIFTMDALKCSEFVF